MKPPLTLIPALFRLVATTLAFRGPKTTTAVTLAQSTYKASSASASGVMRSASPWAAEFTSLAWKGWKANHSECLQTSSELIFLNIKTLPSFRIMKTPITPTSLHFKLPSFAAALSCLLLGVPGLQANTLKAPALLKAQWGASNTNVNLTWQNLRTTGHQAFVIQRKIVSETTAAVVTGVWGNVGFVPSGTSAYTDTLPTSTVTTAWQSVFYRVRPVSGSIDGAGNLTATAFGEPSEVVIRGLYSSTSLTQRDSDADGITDAQEGTYNADLADWADGYADHDGDGIPNAWESNGVASPAAIVDSAAAENLTVSPPIYNSIQKAMTTIAELNAAAGGTGYAALPAYKLIWVRPGVYIGNITPNGNYHFALVRQPASGVANQAMKEVELRATANGPLISTSGSLVLDGFVLTRTPGTSGPLVEARQVASDTDYNSARAGQVRLVNCLALSGDTGAEAVVESLRSRVVISHCTFWMNSCLNGAAAHSCGAGGYLLANGGGTVVVNAAGSKVTGSVQPNHYLQSTARYVIHNSILWNPINTSVPEIYGDAILPEIVGVDGAPAASLIFGFPDHSIDPRLTPDGYLRGPSGIAVPPYEVGQHPTSTAAIGRGYATGGLKVLNDMHGRPRYSPAGRAYIAAPLQSGSDIGAQQWVDSDQDGLPDFMDRSVDTTLAGSNALADYDFDGLNELQEYLSGTNSETSDSTFLTLAQAQNLFASINSSFNSSQYLTASQVAANYVMRSELGNLILGMHYTKAQSDARYWQKGQAILVSPAGDLGMGSYTGGSTPPTAP
jgi:hypothetical protein